MQTERRLKGFDNINVNDYFTIDRSNVTRNNGFKIVGKRFTSNEAKHFFFNRVVNIWNGLPAHVVDSNSTETFKNRLDKYLKNHSATHIFLTRVNIQGTATVVVIISL